MPIHVYLLRHGETQLGHTLRGSTDDALTSIGWQQMQETFDRAVVHDQAWDIIVTSPLRRCADFAIHAAQQLQVPLLMDDCWQEMHFGDWEARNMADLYQEQPDQVAQFWQTPTQFTPPNAESIHAFKYRIELGLKKLQALQLDSVLLVTHGGVIKMLKLLAQQIPLDLILTISADLGSLHGFQLEDEQLQEIDA